MSALLAAVMLPAVAGATDYHVVPDEKSGVAFQAKTTFADFTGRTTDVSARFSIDGHRLHDARVTIPVSSIETGNDHRDRDMEEPKYLDQAEHPEISFKATRFDGGPIVQGKDASGNLAGQLTIRGITKPVIWPVQYRWSGDLLIVSGEMPLDVREWGMQPPTVMLIQRMEPVVHMRFRLTFAADTPRRG